MKHRFYLSGGLHELGWLLAQDVNRSDRLIAKQLPNMQVMHPQYIRYLWEKGCQCVCRTAVILTLSISAESPLMSTPFGPLCMSI